MTKTRKKQKTNLFLEIPDEAFEDEASQEAIKLEDQEREEKRMEKRRKRQQTKAKKKPPPKKPSKKPSSAALFPRVFRVAGVDPGTRNIGVSVLEYSLNGEGKNAVASIMPLSVETISVETESAGDADMVRAVQSLLEHREDLLDVDALFIEEQPHRIGPNQMGNLNVILLASVLLGVWCERWERKWEKAPRRGVYDSEWTAPLMSHLVADMQSGRVKNNYVPPGWPKEKVETIHQRAERDVLQRVPKSRIFQRGMTYTSGVRHKINKKFIFLMCSELYGNSLTNFLREVGMKKADDFCDAIIHAMAGCQHLLQQGLEEKTEIPKETPPASVASSSSSSGSIAGILGSSEVWNHVICVARGGRSKQDQVTARWEPGEQARIIVPREMQSVDLTNE